MAERSNSTVICAKVDQLVFERMGYKVANLQPWTEDGDTIPNSVVMSQEQEAAGGSLEGLIALTGVPFLAFTDPCAKDDIGYAVLSNGAERYFSVTILDLHGSRSPGCRVEKDGLIPLSEIRKSWEYWDKYWVAVEAISERVLP